MSALFHGAEEGGVESSDSEDEQEEENPLMRILKQTFKNKVNAMTESAMFKVIEGGLEERFQKEIEWVNSGDYKKVNMDLPSFFYDYL